MAHLLSAQVKQGWTCMLGLVVVHGDKSDLYTTLVGFTNSEYGLVYRDRRAPLFKSVATHFQLISVRGESKDIKRRRGLSARHAAAVLVHNILA